MADINTSFLFSEENLLLIERCRGRDDFSHLFWGNDDLEKLRVQIRSFYVDQQKGVCSYCRNPVSLTSPLNCHIEHIVPKSKYIEFMFVPQNLCVICADCNTVKKQQEVLEEVIDVFSNTKQKKKYPRSSSAFKIVHPHFDNYIDHIKILRGGYYIDKTPKGHFTIGACKLNRQLHRFGEDEQGKDDECIENIMEKFIGTNDFVVRTKCINELKEILRNL